MIDAKKGSVNRKFTISLLKSDCSRIPSLAILTPLIGQLYYNNLLSNLHKFYSIGSHQNIGYFLNPEGVDAVTKVIALFFLK